MKKLKSKTSSFSFFQKIALYKIKTPFMQIHQEMEEINMKAINIKWDTNDEEWEDTITADIVDVLVDNLPTEVEIPNNLLEGYDSTNFDTYYSDISDWLSNEYGFCHFGFELAN